MEQCRLLQGDCLTEMSNLPRKSIDLVVADPPYLFDNGRWYSSDKSGDRSRLAKSALYSDEGFMKKEMGGFGKDEIDQFLDGLLPIMKVPNIYIFCCEEQVPLYGMSARERNLHFQILVWEKPLSIINKNRFSMNTEFIVRIYDFGTGLNKTQFNSFYSKVLHDKPISGTDKHHPTQKPISICEKLIILSSQEGQTVLDPFMGSGTTGIASIRHKRNFIGIELTKEYFDIAKQRIETELSQLTLF